MEIVFLNCWPAEKLLIKEEKSIETNSEEKFASFLSILGLLSGLFASLNQILRLWPKHEIEEESATYQDLVEDLNHLEAEIAKLKRALAQIEVSTEADSSGTEA